MNNSQTFNKNLLNIQMKASSTNDQFDFMNLSDVDSNQFCTSTVRQNKSQQNNQIENNNFFQDLDDIGLSQEKQELSDDKKKPSMSFNNPELNKYCEIQSNLRQKNLPIQGNVFEPTKEELESTLFAISELINTCNYYETKSERSNLTIAGLKKELSSFNNLTENFEAKEQNNVNQKNELLNKNRDQENVTEKMKQDLDNKKKEYIQKEKAFDIQKKKYDNELRKKDNEIENLKNGLNKPILKERNKIKNEASEISGVMETKNTSIVNKSAVLQDCKDFFNCTMSNTNNSQRNELNKYTECLQKISVCFFEQMSNRTKNLINNISDQKDNGDKQLAHQNLQQPNKIRPNPVLGKKLIKLKEELICLTPESTNDAQHIMLENLSRFEDYFNKSDEFLQKHMETLKIQNDSKNPDKDMISASVDEKRVYNIVQNYKSVIENQNVLISRLLTRRNVNTDKENQDFASPSKFEVVNNIQASQNLLENEKKKLEFYKEDMDHLKVLIDQSRQQISATKNCTKDKNNELFNRSLVEIPEANEELENAQTRILKGPQEEITSSTFKNYDNSIAYNKMIEEQ